MKGHTSAPAGPVHTPFSVGLVCPGSVGIRVPFASFGVHVCVLSMHQLPPTQSASTLQPPRGSHLPFVLHAPERHTTPPLPELPAVHGPSPFA